MKSPESKTWKLIWSDEFDYTGLPDPAKWSYERGLIRNHELQFYTEGRRENARVENQRLIIEARKEAWEGSAFTSASIHTLGKAEWTYGRIEVRAKLPSARGTWPAAWTLGTIFPKTGWPLCGEIDIMEHVGYDPGAIHGNVHFGAPDYFNANGCIQVDSATTGFHVYAIEWDAEKIAYFTDGICYFVFAKKDAPDGRWCYDHPHYLILNLAVGGAWGGKEGVDETAFPQRYEIDYVRVYKQATD